MSVHRDGGREREITLRIRGCLWDFTPAEFSEIADDLGSLEDVRADEIERWLREHREDR